MKRGQIQLSFSVIFSIIIIIALLAVSFYIISAFLDTSECEKIGLFYNDLNENVEKAYVSSFYRDTFVGKLPSGITSVCFGNLSLGNTETEEYKAFRNKKNSNAFLYPPNKACSGELSDYNVRHLNNVEFLCFPVENNEVKLIIEHDRSGPLVSVYGAIK